MATTVHVDLGDRSYDIAIGAGILEGTDFVPAAGPVLLVSDDQIAPLHADRVSARLADAGCTVHRADVPAGEPSKSLSRLEELCEAAVAAGLDRKATIVALGGGVVGDLGGFLAASYLRGVGLVQIPTSLLAMVDSSVGGKTGVNLASGKNLVGAFYQPRQVIAELEFLTTLSEREFLSGMAEVIKYGIIHDAVLFDYLEKEVDAIRARDMSCLEYLVARSCEIKAEVVAADEREGGLRAILNYGHTLGHAIEQVAGYGELLHGEAIAIGMVYASELSVRLEGLSREACDRITALIGAYGLPTTPKGGDWSWEGLRDVMSADKKSRNSIPYFVLASDIGTVRFGCEVDEQVMREAWDVCNQ